MDHIIDTDAQRQIARVIDRAVSRVLGGWINHGNEEAITSALGQELMSQSFSDDGLQVQFNYRQLNKHTEEGAAGADGGFVVRVETPTATVKKAAIFQAKRLGGSGPVRRLTMNAAESNRLTGQVEKMLNQTDEAVAVFYTEREIYVVDAAPLNLGHVNSPMRPLFEGHRLVTLGTYLGKWLPRCTRGDQSADLVSRVEHQDGFREGISMDVVCTRPSIQWRSDPEEDAWRRKN